MGCQSTLPVTSRDIGFDESNEEEMLSSMYSVLRIDQIHQIGECLWQRWASQRFLQIISSRVVYEKTQAIQVIHCAKNIKLDQENELACPFLLTW